MTNSNMKVAKIRHENRLSIWSHVSNIYVSVFNYGSTNYNNIYILLYIMKIIIRGLFKYKRYKIK